MQRGAERHRVQCSEVQLPSNSPLTNTTLEFFAKFKAVQVRTLTKTWCPHPPLQPHPVSQDCFDAHPNKSTSQNRSEACTYCHVRPFLVTMRRTMIMTKMMPMIMTMAMTMKMTMVMSTVMTMMMIMIMTMAMTMKLTMVMTMVMSPRPRRTTAP